MPRRFRGRIAFGYRVGNVRIARQDPCCNKTFRVIDHLIARDFIAKRQCGPICFFTEPYPDVRFAPNLRCGFESRLASDPPVADFRLLRRFKKFVSRMCGKLLEPLPGGLDMSPQWWLENSNYSKGRRDELLACWNSRIDQAITKHDKKCKFFAKRESYREYKPPRLIVSRTDYFKCYVGAACKRMEHEVYKLPYFIKHVPVLQRPDYIANYLHRPGFRYAWSDYSKYERHFVPQVMDSCELVLYRYLLKNYPQQSDVLCEALRSRNYLESKVATANVLGRRMSGEMVTSLGNGFTNLMLMLFNAERLHYNPLDIRGVVEGDDGLFAFPGCVPTSSMFSELGFTIKIDWTDELSEASFCGIICDRIKKENVVDPVRFLSNFGWTDSNMMMGGPTVLKRLMRAKALSSLCEAPACPIVTALASRVEFLTRGIAPAFDVNNWYEQQVKPWEKFVPGLVHPPALSTRDVMAREFGVSIPAQIELERYFAHVELNQIMSHPMLSDLAKNLSDQVDYSTRFVVSL